MGVDGYIKKARVERQPALNRIRSICKDVLTGFEECMDYGMPCYKKDGKMEIAFADQKHNIALYILKKSVLDKYRTNFPKSRIGKGCIRYPNPDKMDFALIEEMIRDSYNSGDRIC